MPEPGTDVSVTTVGQLLPGGGLSALKLVLNRPSPTASLQQLSGVVSPASSSGGLHTSQTLEPDTPRSPEFDRSLLAPVTPSPVTPSPKESGCCRRTRLCLDSLLCAQSVGGSSCYSSEECASRTTATSDIDACEEDECESTSGHAEATPTHATLTDLLSGTYESAEEIRSCVVKGVPVARGADSGAKAIPSRYVGFGCAIACLCVFAMWAKHASVAALATRMFPT